jgi:hypothetical protein
MEWFCIGLGAAINKRFALAPGSHPNFALLSTHVLLLLQSCVGAFKGGDGMLNVHIHEIKRPWYLFSFIHHVQFAFASRLV